MPHSPFSDLHLRDLGRTAGGRAQFELTRDLWYFHHLTERDYIEVVVVQGFVTDFASVPRFFWRLFPPAGDHNPAAVLHDWLYTHGECSRFLADAIFLEAMGQVGVPWWKRWLMWAAVRVFGGPCFRRKQEEGVDA